MNHSNPSCSIFHVVFGPRPLIISRPDLASVRSCRSIWHRERELSGGPAGDADPRPAEPHHQEPPQRVGHLHQAAAQTARPALAKQHALWAAAGLQGPFLKFLRVLDTPTQTLNGLWRDLEADGPSAPPRLPPQPHLHLDASPMRLGVVFLKSLNWTKTETWLLKGEEDHKMSLYCTVGCPCLCDGNSYMQTHWLMYMFLVFVCSILYVCNCTNVRSTFLYSVDWYFCIHSAICDCFLIWAV